MCCKENKSQFFWHYEKMVECFLQKFQCNMVKHDLRVTGHD